MEGSHVDQYISKRVPSQRV